MLRTLILFACTLPGCDALTVHPFAGSVLALTIRQDATTGPSAAGHHLELWARDASNDILRVQLFYDSADYMTTFGVAVRQAISLDDPCVIDEHGNLLVSPAAYPSTVDVGGVLQTPDEQAQSIRNRIAQLTAPPSGIEPTNLLALVPYDPTPLPVVAADAAPGERLAACHAYWAASALTYTPNPLQVTSPIHGTVYGFLSYVTGTPPTDYDGLRFDSPIDLSGIVELFFTDEPDAVDPAHRGPLYLASTPTPGGNGVLHFDLNGPHASGTATVITGLAKENP
jgi:hypothetical protein